MVYKKFRLKNYFKLFLNFLYPQFLSNIHAINTKCKKVYKNYFIDNFRASLSESNICSFVYCLYFFALLHAAFIFNIIWVSSMSVLIYNRERTVTWKIKLEFGINNLDLISVIKGGCSRITSLKLGSFQFLLFSIWKFLWKKKLF